MKKQLLSYPSKLKKWLGLEMYSFPLQISEHGYLPAFHNQEGDLRCPHCGRTDFGVKGHTTLTCKTCITTFDYYGILGLKQKIV